MVSFMQGGKSSIIELERLAWEHKICDFLVVWEAMGFPLWYQTM